MWIAFAQLVDGLLIANHAAHQCHQQITALRLGLFEQGKLVVRLLFWCLTHAARIEHHKICLIHVGLFPTHFIQHGLDALRISLVHLATNRPDMVFPACNRRCRGHPVASPSINGIDWCKLWSYFAIPLLSRVLYTKEEGMSLF